MSRASVPPTSHLRERRGAAAAAIIIGVVAVIAIGFIVWWFALRDAGGESAKLAEAYIPAEAEVVGGVNPARLLRSQVARDLAKSQGVDLAAIEAQIAQQSGLTVDDIESLAFGVSGAGPDAAPTSFAAVATGKAENLQKLQAALTLVAARLQTEVHQRDLRQPVAEAEAAAPGGAPAAAPASAPGETSFEVIGDTVVGGHGALGAQTIARARSGGGAPAADPGRDELQKALDTGAAFWFVGRIPADVDIAKLTGGMMLPGMAEVGQPTHFGVSLNTTDTLTVRAAVRFSGSAKPAYDALDPMLSLGKAFASGPEAELLKQLDIHHSGNVLGVSIELTAAQVEQLQSGAAGGMLPF